MSSADAPVLFEIKGAGGFVTLNRPKALNALSLEMIHLLNLQLLAWQGDPNIAFVALRGMGKTGPFGNFCAGGDIRFFYQAGLAQDPSLGDFFTHEYTLNHLIFNYAKPYIVFMDGINMGGGMGLCGHGRPAGGTLRIATERSMLAMPETHIGLFPDVGGGYFLSRCPGFSGEWLALTGATIGAGEAVALGLADAYIESSRLSAAWDTLGEIDPPAAGGLHAWIAAFSGVPPAYAAPSANQIDPYFSLGSVPEIVHACEADPAPWAQQAAQALRHNSALMAHVTLEQVRRARSMSLSDELRMERDLVQHCFSPHHLGRTPAQSETVEGIRALVIAKDHSPRWNPKRIEDVTPQMVHPFFNSPWTPEKHPLCQLD